MFIDNQTVLSDAQALTASGASTNVLDLAAAGFLGAGEPLAVVLWVDVAPDGTTGDETYVVKLQSDDADTFGSATDLPNKTVTIPRTTAVAGTVYVIDLDPNDITERFLRAYATLAGTTPSITFTIAVMPRSFIGKWRALANAYTITG